MKSWAHLLAIYTPLHRTALSVQRSSIFLLASLCLTAPLQAEVSELWLSETITRCPQPLTLAPNGQLTLELPEDVQVAAPAQRGRLTVHIAPQLVVVQAQDPLRWRGDLIAGLTVILKTGARLYCEFTPPQGPVALQNPTLSSVIRFRRPTPFLEAQRAALSLLHQLQAEDALGDPLLSEREQLGLQEVRRGLHNLTRRAHQKLTLEQLSASPISLSPHPPIRAQEGLIYVTLTQRFTMGESLYVRAQLLNRSQPAYQLNALELSLATGDTLSIPFYPRSVTAPPDGVGRYFAFKLPLSALKMGEVRPTLSMTSVDGRSLSLSLPADP